MGIWGKCMHLEVHPASRFEARACTPPSTHKPPYTQLPRQRPRACESLSRSTKSRRLHYLNHVEEVTLAKGAGYINGAIHLQLHRDFHSPQLTGAPIVKRG